MKIHELDLENISGIKKFLDHQKLLTPKKLQKTVIAY